MFAGPRDRLISARQGSTPLTLAELQKAISIKFIGIWVDSFIYMSGNGRNGDMCARGNSYAIGKGERAQREADPGHWKYGARTSAFRTCGVEEGIKRTEGWVIKPLGLPEETVDFVHFVYPGFRPTFLFNHPVNFLAEGFDILRIPKKTIQCLGERLLKGIDQDCIIGGTLSLAKDVELIDTKLTKSIRRAKPSTDLSTPLASLISHMSISFCEPAI